MGMDIWQSILIGIVSGFTELLPVSAEAHRSLLRCLMGLEEENPAFALVLHIASLAALVWCCRREIVALRQTSALLRIPPRRRRRTPDFATVNTLRHLKTALVLLTAGRLLTGVLAFVADELQILTFSTAAGGVLLLIPSLVRNGNKDSRNMLRLDSLLMGLAAGLSVIPGFSVVGGVLAAGISRGVDRGYALKFAWLLAIPGLILHIVFDILSIIGGGAAVSAVGIAGLAAGGIVCFIGSMMGYLVMNSLVRSTNFSPFSYYCFGVGLFAFVLFLTI